MPREASEMFHIEQYGDDHDSIGMLVHSFVSYERIMKWDGQALFENPENPYNITVCDIPRMLNIYVVASTKFIASANF